MNVKQLYISLILLFCTSIIMGQIVVSEGAAITLNPGMSDQSTRIIQPKISLISPEIDEYSNFEWYNETINIIGRIDDHQGIESVIINDTRASVGRDGVFDANIALDPGVQMVEITAYADDIPIKDSFEIVYNTPMMIFTRTVRKSDYHALIIGINEYEDPDIRSLDRPVRDANKIYEVLTTQYTFKQENTHLLKNATKIEIESKLDYLAKTVKPNDNLLIFYAGHGEWNNDSDVGYWWPADATYGSFRTYITNSVLVAFIKEIKVKHTLVIADACFAGAIFNSRSSTKDPDKAIQEYYALPSCKAMTSGSYDEVNDQSAFTKYLVEGLSENTEEAFTALKLYSDFHRPVKINSGIEPRYGDIKINRDRGGQFVFIKKLQ